MTQGKHGLVRGWRNQALDGEMFGRHIKNQWGESEEICWMVMRWKINALISQWPLQHWSPLVTSLAWSFGHHISISYIIEAEKSAGCHHHHHHHHHHHQNHWKALHIKSLLKTGGRDTTIGILYPWYRDDDDGDDDDGDDDDEDNDGDGDDVDDEICSRQLEASQSAKNPLSHQNHTFDPLTSASDHHPLEMEDNDVGL